MGAKRCWPSSGPPEFDGPTRVPSDHVSNILAKLGAEGRTAAVALAQRRGLLGSDST